MQSTRRHLFKLAGGAALLSGLSAVQAAVPRSSIEKFDEQYDVVIVGSGFAGHRGLHSRKAAQKRRAAGEIEEMASS